ncbi:MAG: hypothetical protein IPK79_03690 [Vampirovibrionales bacterium]|nr:hypothetical protein [Vampirovibrionales bacterium]
MTLPLVRSRPALFFMTFMKDGDLMRDLTRAVFHAKQKAVSTWARCSYAARLPGLKALLRSQATEAPPAKPDVIEDLLEAVKTPARSRTSRGAAPVRSSATPPAPRRRAAALGKPRSPAFPTRVLRRWIKRKAFLLRHQAMIERDLSLWPLEAVCWKTFVQMSRRQRQRYARRILRPRKALEWAEWLVSEPGEHPESGRYRTAGKPASSASGPDNAAPARYLHDRSPP